MKKILIGLVLVLVALTVYWFILRKKSSGPKAPKPVAIALKKHSDSFNGSVDKLVADYLAMKDAFVEADTTAAKQHTRDFVTALDSLKLDELKKDTAGIFQTVQLTVSDIRGNAMSLLAQTDITEMRHDFSMLTDMMYPAFFKAINYEGQQLYLQNCPMAFNDDQPANWISSNAEVVNPYLGKAHPKYKATMLHCGEVKDSVLTK